MAMSRKDCLYSAFVGGIPLDVSEDEIRDLFSSCGLIENMYLARSDKNIWKYGFIRYSTPEEVLKAISKLNKWNINGSRLIVDIASDTTDRVNKYKDAQKCKSKSVSSIKAKTKLNTISTEVPNEDTKKSGKIYSVYVGDLHRGVTEGELKDIFSSCGFVDSVYLQNGDTQNIFGFIHYSSPEDAVQAVQQLHGTTIGDKTIIVELSKQTASQLPKEFLHPDLDIVKSKEFNRESRLSLYSVFISHIHSSVTQKEIENVFSTYGSIQDFFFTKYEDTGKPYGFIRYSDPEHAVNAVTHLHGRKIKNQPITVQFAADTAERIPKGIEPTKCPSIDSQMNEKACQSKSSADKFISSSTLLAKPKSRGNKPDHFSVYVGNLHPDVTKKEIRDLFSGCGHLVDLYISDDQQNNKYGFVRFSKLEDVKNAVSHLNGWKVKDMAIIVDIAHDTVGRLGKGKDLRSAVPSIDPSLCFDEKSVCRSSEMNSVINRSRLHENYSLVRSNMCDSRGSSSFSRIFELVDRQSFNQKSYAVRLDKPSSSKLPLQGLCDKIKTGANKLTAALFQEKMSEVAKIMGSLMESDPPHKKSSEKDGPRSSRIRSSPTSLKTKRENVSSEKFDHKQEPKSMKNCAPSKMSSPAIKCSPISIGLDSGSCKSRRSQFSPSSYRPSAKGSGENSVFENGRRLRKQMNSGSISHQPKIQLDIKSMADDEAFEDDEEMIRKIDFKIFNRDIYQPDADDSWGELTHSALASDLFCKVLDSKSDASTQRTGSSECASSSSSEACSAAESSGYSSFYESGRIDSSRRSRQATTTTEQKYL